MGISNGSNKRTSKKKQKNSLWHQLKNTSFGESRSYLFEYGLLLLLTGGLIYIVLSMIRSFYITEIANIPYFFFQNTDILLLSALTVILPLVIILIQRTSEAEASNPLLKNLNARKVFLGLFLAVISIWALASSILFVNSLFAYLSNGLLSAADFDWETTLTYFVSASILIATAWTFGNDYRYVSKDQFARSRHFYRYGLVIVTLLVTVLFLIFPFRENRSAYIDEQIVQDLYSISALVDSYNTQNGRLPGNLSDLGLSGEQIKRASMYGYLYEIKSDTMFSVCANFKTSSSEEISGVYDLSAPSLYNHGSGLQCFDFPVGGYGQNDEQAVNGYSTETSNYVDLNNPNNLQNADEQPLLAPAPADTLYNQQ